MKIPDGKNQSSWHAGVKIPSFPPLRRPLTTDVCVVGAGFAGLTTAYFLAREGVPVVVVDEGPIGSGQTGQTSAHLASAIDDRFVEIERLHGEASAKLAYESHATAIDSIERIVADEKINCGFTRLDAFLSSVPSDRPDFLEKELAAAKRAGFADCEVLPQGGLGPGPCIRFGRQARFHPLRYLVGLADAIKRLGGRIHTGKRVMDVQGRDPKTKKAGHVEFEKKLRITANHIVVATNTPSPINDWFGIYTKQTSYRTYVIGASIPRGSVADALYWDTGDPYHYVRLQPTKNGENDLLLIGGEDHKTGQIPNKTDPFANLEKWGREHYPALGRVRFHWSGQVQEPADGLAFIGRALTATEEVYVATGDSGMGLTHGTIAGQLITDLIQGRTNAWEQLYNPSRKMLNTEYLKENLNVVAQYTDFITPGDVKSIDDIKPGEGGSAPRRPEQARRLPRPGRNHPQMLGRLHTS